MPKGAKKRKAEKRKKELEANDHINSSSGGDNSQVNDGVKSQDERESDGGEADSPISQDQDNIQHPFKDGNAEPDKSDLLTTQAIIGNNDSVEGITGNVKGNEPRISERKQEMPNVLAGFNTEQLSGAPLLGDANRSLVAAIAPVVDSGIPELSTSVEAMDVVENAWVENSAVHDALQSASKNNDDVLPTSDEFIDVASKENKDNCLPNADESFGKSSAVVGSPESANGGEISTSSCAPATEKSNGAEDTPVIHSSENQSLLASAPRMSQRTSWLSCCGLFDVIAGFNR